MAHKVTSFRCAQGELEKIFGADKVGEITSFKDIDGVLSIKGDFPPIQGFRDLDVILDKIDVEDGAGPAAPGPGPDSTE